MPKKQELQHSMRKDRIRERRHRIILTLTWPEYIIRKIWRYQTFIFYSDERPQDNPSVIQRLMARRRLRRRKANNKPKKSLKIRKQRAILESMHLKNRQSIKTLRYKKHDPHTSQIAARNFRRRNDFDKNRIFL